MPIPQLFDARVLIQGFIPRELLWLTVARPTLESFLDSASKDSLGELSVWLVLTEGQERRQPDGGNPSWKERG